MIKLMAVELTNIWMGLSTLEIGKKINNTGMVLKHGPMLQNMKEIMNSVKSMVLVLSNGLMVRHILANFIITIYMVKVFTLGQIIVNMKVNGVLTKCMVKVLLPGLTTEDILENMQMIKKEATVSSYGQMVDVTEVNGSMENSMEKEPMLPVQDKKSTENGKKENV